MIQRIQSVYLALAFVILAVCLCLPVGVFSPQSAMGTDITMFNLWELKDNNMTFSEFPMFILLLLTCVMTLYTIFSYKNRPKQIKLCSLCMLLVVAWIVVYLLFVFVFAEKDLVFTPTFAACLPIVALILYYLARRGVIHDEKLVKAADRIR